MNIESRQAIDPLRMNAVANGKKMEAKKRNKKKSPVNHFDNEN